MHVEWFLHSFLIQVVYQFEDFSFNADKKQKHVWITWLLSKDAFPERQYILSCPPNHIYNNVKEHCSPNSERKHYRRFWPDDIKKKINTARRVQHTHYRFDGWICVDTGQRTAYVATSAGFFEWCKIFVYTTVAALKKKNFSFFAWKKPKTLITSWELEYLSSILHDSLPKVCAKW